MEDYNYFSSYGDYGSPTTLIPKKTVEEITANAPKDMDTFKEIADKINEMGGGSGSSADIEEINQKIDDNKAAADSKFEEIDAALEEKADASDLENLATKAEVEQVKTDVETILQDAPESLDTLKEIADLLATKQDAAAVVDALAAKVDTTDFESHVSSNDEAFAAINETMENKVDSEMLEDYATKDYVDGKVAEITVPTNLSELTNDDNYVQDANYVHTDVNFTEELQTKLNGLENYDDTELSEKVTALENAGYVDGTQLEEAINGIELPSMDGYVRDANYVHTDNNYTAEEKEKLAGLENYDDEALSARVQTLENAGYTTMSAVEAMGYSTFDGNYSSLLGAPEIPTVPTDVSAFTNDAGYLTAATADERYYGKEAANNIFIAQSQYEDDMELKADKTELGNYATDSELANAVRELVVRLNKLEAQNAILVEKGTDSADDITGMSAEDAANADVVVATDEAIEALATPKVFNSISVAGGEVGGNTVINLLATDSVDVNGLTVSGTKGAGNGKIVFGSNDVTISNLNIEPGCTVYNVFEGKQDKAAENCIDNFTATNIVVNDIDLKHNVFNIYQVNDGANILIKDSVFNLDVANSNVLRMSNITNAKNVTITFENVDWNYEDKAYTASDAEWAGLMIYQPYGSDVAYNGDFTNTQTWTVNVKDCRYNGELITENLVGTIKQAVYQYDVNGSGAAETPSAIGTVNFE